MSEKRTTSLGRLSRLGRKKPAGKPAASGETATKREDAVAAAQADTFIDEVSDELRKERLYALFRQYGPYGLAAIVAMVVAAAAFEWRQSASQSAAEDAGGALLTAESGSEDAEAKAGAVLAAVEEGGARLVAELRAAELRRQAGDVAGAVALYKEIAARSDLDRKYRDLAAIKAVMAEIDTGKPDALLASIEPLTAPGRPFRVLALELQAAAHLRLGQTEAARRALGSALETEGAPQGLRTRAGQLLEALGGPLERPTPVGSTGDASESGSAAPDAAEPNASGG